MIEIGLAVAVLASVAVVGVLISIGNERQRRAIEELRIDLRKWALGDLEIKRSKASKGVEIYDPLKWLDEAARKVIGTSPRLNDIAGVMDNPDAIVAVSENAKYLMFSPVDPEQMRRLIRGYDKRRPKNGALPPGLKRVINRRNRSGIYELSALNAGIFFDLEADKVWQMLANRPLDANILWVYEIPSQWVVTEKSSKVQAP